MGLFLLGKPLDGAATSPVALESCVGKPFGGYLGATSVKRDKIRCIYIYIRCTYIRVL